MNRPVLEESLARNENAAFGRILEYSNLLLLRRRLVTGSNVLGVGICICVWFVVCYFFYLLDLRPRYCHFGERVTVVLLLDKCQYDCCKAKIFYWTRN